MKFLRCLPCLLALALLLANRVALAELTTWDGKHAIDRIEVTVVYFVPQDRAPLADWRERVAYFCRRIEHFHQREFDGQSQLKTKIINEPFHSASSTEQLRAGDGDHTFFQTLREVDKRLEFATGQRTAYPILLVLSDINWRPLDDFYRLKKGPKAEVPWEFEGQLIDSRHFPGSALGGARATYLGDRGVGWGLVSADGWRVPYCGSDCVVYHEGVGHPIGLPHPEPGDGSVMSFGQYRGWLSQSWLDGEQKTRLGWIRPAKPFDRRSDAFSSFLASPEPLMPRPGEPVRLKLQWPTGAAKASCQVRVQTDLHGPWLEVSHCTERCPPDALPLGTFDRPTPVSYRIDAQIDGGESVELWGYFQVRSQPDEPPLPQVRSVELAADHRALDAAPAAEEVDLLSLIDMERGAVSGAWTWAEGRLTSPNQPGARLELPHQAPEEYRLVAVVEPLDEPNGLILGQSLGGRRFVVLLNFQTDEGPSSALENIDGKNVGSNATTLRRALFKKGRPSQVICTVRAHSVEVSVDGRPAIEWQGDASRLSLSDYWRTPHEDVLFLGAYSCRYRISRLSLTAL